MTERLYPENMDSLEDFKSKLEWTFPVFIMRLVKDRDTRWRRECQVLSQTNIVLASEINELKRQIEALKAGSDGTAPGV